MLLVAGGVLDVHQAVKRELTVQNTKPSRLVFGDVVNKYVFLLLLFGCGSGNVRYDSEALSDALGMDVEDFSRVSRVRFSQSQGWLYNRDEQILEETDVENILFSNRAGCDEIAGRRATSIIEEANSSDGSSLDVGHLTDDLEDHFRKSNAIRLRNFTGLRDGDYRLSIHLEDLPNEVDVGSYTGVASITSRSLEIDSVSESHPFSIQVDVDISRVGIDRVVGSFSGDAFDLEGEFHAYRCKVEHLIFDIPPEQLQ